MTGISRVGWVGGQEVLRLRNVTLTSNRILLLDEHHPLLQKQFNSNVREIVKSALKYYRQLVFQSLRTTRKQYWNNVTVREEAGSQLGMKRWVFSVGDKNTSDAKLARYLEFGRSPYDMKESLLKSRKAKIGKKGRYAVIPIRIGGGNWRQGIFGAKGRGGIFQAEKPVALLMRKPLNFIITSKEYPFIEKLPTSYPVNKTTGAEAAYSRYERLTRTSRGWKIFRTVHEGHLVGGPTIAKGEKWVHPGFKPRNFLKAVMGYINKECADSFVRASTEGFSTGTVIIP